MRILVIDDEPVARALVTDVGQRLGYEVLQASTFAQGISLGQCGVDVVVLDKFLPDGDGLAKIKDIKQLPGRPSVLVVTGNGDGDIAEEALRSGAWEFLHKPFGVKKLQQIISQTIAHRMGSTRSEHKEDFERSEILGSSQSLKDALSCLWDAATSDVNVLLLGETGVGKELFARTLYKNSLRSAGPFIAVDCAALPHNLLESHLFGHVRGAFTGADRAQNGLLLAAHGGTLFLDEVGELSLGMQKAFLRALELRCFRPVGSVVEMHSDFRLVAATNKDLHLMVEQGLFRKDLLYRLQGMNIYIPSLRDRKEDIATLTGFAIKRYCKKYDLPIKAIKADFIETLLTHTWPGNVRELLHTIERACISAKQEKELFTIHLPTDLRVSIARGLHEQKPEPIRAMPEPSMKLGVNGEIPQLKDWKKIAEYDYIQMVLWEANGDIRKCANIAGVSRGHFYELLKRHGISTH